MRKNFSIWFLLPSIIFGACIAEIKAQPSNEALFTRASDSVKAGKYDEAIQYLTQIITSTPNSYKAHLLRGICYWGKKELEYAEIQKDPARAYRLEAEIYGNLKPGEVQPKSASSLSAIADLTRAIQLDPTAFSPYNIRGKVYLREKDLEPAIADFQKVIELKRDYQQEPTLKGLNETLIKTRNEYAKSLQMRAINLKISIGYSKEYQAKATGEELKRARIQTEENEKIYRSLLTKAAQTFAPNDFYTFNGRGDCYEDLENWNAALADFSEAIKFRPNDLSLINKRAAVYDKIGNKEKAISDLSIVIAKQNVPQNEKFYQNEAYFKRAKLYTEQGKLNEALADLDKAIADNPKYYIAYLERGKLHAAKGSKQLARADFLKAGGTPNLLAISQKEIDILDGKIKPKTASASSAKTNQTPNPNSSSATPNNDPQRPRQRVFKVIDHGYAKYEGETYNGVPDGKGKYADSNSIFEGEYKNNLRDGKGRETWISGSWKGCVYEGEWKKHQRTGSGRMTCPNGKIQEGHFENGVFKGKLPPRPVQTNTNVAQVNNSSAEKNKNTVDGLLDVLEGESWLDKGDVADKAKNYPEALKWYRKASEIGYERATYNVGTYYYAGLGVEQNYTEAMIWFKIAADKGYANAIFNIAVMYYNGQGVAKNNTEAVYWFRKAADKGVQAAKDALKKMNVPETATASDSKAPSNNARKSGKFETNAGTYEGEIENGKPHGRGKMILKDGSGTYDGNWVNGAIQGTGTLTSANGDKYVGDFVKAQKMGKGTYTLINGEKYVGDWVNNRRHGKGILYEKAGKVIYSGCFVEDKPQPGDKSCEK